MSMEQDILKWEILREEFSEFPRPDGEIGQRDLRGEESDGDGVISHPSAGSYLPIENGEGGKH